MRPDSIRIAQTIVLLWKQREVDMRAVVPDPERPGCARNVESPWSSAIARCRRELAAAFGLPEEQQ